MYLISNMDFKCDRCGKCCKHRGDLALTPMDIFKISQHLNMSCEETVKKYTRLSHRHNFPQIVLLSEGKQDTCVFYSKNCCKIYPVRPSQCYLFPLILLTSLSDPNPKFSIQKCYSKTRSEEQIPVQDWISQSSGRFASEKELLNWYILQFSRLEKICILHSDKLNIIKKILYCDYDLSGDMELQVRTNLNKIFSADF